MPPTTTPIVRTGRWSCGRRIRRLAYTSPASASQVRCAGATDSAGCSTSTTDELHERISAPHGRPLQAAVVSALSFAVGAALPRTLMVLTPIGVRIPVTALSALALLGLLGAISARLGGAGESDGRPYG